MSYQTNKLTSYRANRLAGFTLLEFLIYSVILVIFSAAVVNVFIAIGKGQTQMDVRSEVNSNLRFAIERISQDLRAATVLSTPSLTGPANSTSTLVMTVSGTTITYCVAANQLRRLSGAGTCDAASEAITSNKVIVDIPTFTRLENTNTVLTKTFISVQIALTVNSTDLVGERKFSANKKTTVTLP